MKGKKQQSKVLRKKKGENQCGFFLDISWNFQMEGSDFRSELFKKKIYNGCYSFRYKCQLDIYVSGFSAAGQDYLRNTGLPENVWLLAQCIFLS